MFNDNKLVINSLGIGHYLKTITAMAGSRCGGKIIRLIRS